MNSESRPRDRVVSSSHVHKCYRRQEPPVELFENLLVKQCHVDFAFPNEQRVSIENLVGQRATHGRHRPDLGAVAAAAGFLAGVRPALRAVPE